MKIYRVLNQHLKRCSISLIITDMQIKTTMRCQVTPVRKLIIKKSTNNICWIGCEVNGTFHYRRLEWKSRKSRKIWSNRKIWLSSTEWSREKAKRSLKGERTGHSRHPLPTTQENKYSTHGHHKMAKQKSDWLYSLKRKMEKLYTVSKKKTGSWLWLRTRNPYCQIQTEI